MDKEYIEKLVETEQRSKSNTKRLDEHDKEIEDLKKNQSILENMSYRMGKVEESTEKINAKLDVIQEKSNTPLKEKAVKWDKLIDYLFYSILAYCLYRLGLK